MAADLQTPDFIYAFHFSGGQAQGLSESAPLTEWLSRDGFLWIHFNLSDSRCQRWLRDALGLGPEMAAEFVRPATRQYLSDTHGWLVGKISDFAQDFDKESPAHAWLHVLTSDKVLVTGRLRAVQSAERIRRELNMGRLPRSPHELLGFLLLNYPDTLDTILHRLLGELELIEDHVLEEQHRGERRQLRLLRRETAQLHRHMRALRRTLLFAEREIEQPPPQLGSILARLTSHDHDFESLEQRARFFHDEIDANLAAETNRQLYILSALTALFLPPSLVAGLFGMNVAGSPLEDASFGFWLAVAACTLSSLAVSLLLWRLNRR